MFIVQLPRSSMSRTRGLHTTKIVIFLGRSRRRSYARFGGHRFSVDSLEATWGRDAYGLQLL